MRGATSTFVLFFATAIVLYLLHRFLFSQFPGAGHGDFHFSLEAAYGFFSACSVAILAIVHIVEKRNRDVVGMSFLLASSAKMVGVWFFIRPVLYGKGADPAEKMNFLALFILFLAIETVLTIRVLNKKQ